MSAQYVRPVYQFGELIDSYGFNIATLVLHSSDRSIFSSIAHNREATLTLYGPCAKVMTRFDIIIISTLVLSFVVFDSNPKVVRLCRRLACFFEH